MAKGVVKVDGEETVVREDTAKAYKGVNWAIASIAAFVIILAFVFVVFFLRSASDGSVDSPVDTRPAGTRSQ
jgi:hypothetical protein